MGNVYCITKSNSLQWVKIIVFPLYFDSITSPLMKKMGATCKSDNKNDLVMIHGKH